MKKICEECKQEFEAQNKKVFTCSKHCGGKRTERIKKERGRVNTNEHTIDSVITFKNLFILGALR